MRLSTCFTNRCLLPMNILFMATSVTLVFSMYFGLIQLDVVTLYYERNTTCIRANSNVGQYRCCDLNNCMCGRSALALNPRGYML